MWAHLAGRQRRHRPLPRARRPRGRARRLDALLDGEIVALDDAGVPSFERLQPRMQAGSAAAIRRGVADQPVVLHGVRRALARRPLHLRAALHRPACGARAPRVSPGPSWQTPPTDLRRRRRDVLETAAAARARGRRRQAASTAPTSRGSGPTRGARSRPTRRPGARGRRLAPGRGTARGPARFAARRLPRLEDGGRAALRRPRRLRHRRDPARSARGAAAAVRRVRRRPSSAHPASPTPCGSNPSWWSRSAFHEWTSAGVLRAPRYRGVRDDKPAADVVRET